MLGAPEASVAAEDMDVALREVEAADEAPSLSRYLEREGTRDEMLEFLVHRSAYQLKEADPHSWALPRLTGAPKAAMVEIQADEYGGGNAERMHSALFAKSMDRLGLDARYGAYLDRIPGVTLATVNLMSLLGLHRRWRGALVGHLALFEMSSLGPQPALRQRPAPSAATARRPTSSTSTSTADAVHEAIAAVDLAGGLVGQDPALSADVIWGARALVELEGRFARPAARRLGAGPLLAAGATRQRLTDEILRGRWSQAPMTTTQEDTVEQGDRRHLDVARRLHHGPDPGLGNARRRRRRLHEWAFGAAALARAPRRRVASGAPTPTSWRRR